MENNKSKVISLGCRLNFYESEVIKSLIKKHNINDYIIINSCAVTNEAEKKVSYEIRKAKRLNPSKKIIVTGCAAQINPTKYAHMPEVNLILGNNDGLTADRKLIDVALNSLEKSGLEVKHNHPFKGGFLTRSKGNPSEGIHALQLEMSKDLYMFNNELDYHPVKAEKIKQDLLLTFKNLISFIHE